MARALLLKFWALDVVAWHYHLYAFWQFDGTGHVSCTEVELWTVAFEERSMTAAFVFGQDVHLRFELGVLAKPGSIKPHTKFESEVYILSKDEGGRHTPFFKGYRPQFYFRTTDVTGTIERSMVPVTSVVRK